MIRWVRLTTALASACSLFALGVFASTASAVTHCSKNVLCGNKAEESLRDDLASATGYGSSMVAVNTAGAIRLTGFLSGKGRSQLVKVPSGYAYIGIDLHENQETSTTACHKATGWVTFANLSNTEGYYEKELVLTNTSPGYNGAWPVSINSSNTGCTIENRGKVTIEAVALNELVLGALSYTYTGTLTGRFVQPGSCSGGSGGIELAASQPGITSSEKSVEKIEIDNGTSGSPAYLCFVAANNYLYPEKAPSWTPSIGNVVGD